MLKFLSKLFKPKEYRTIKTQHLPSFKAVVSYTTRPMRECETEGVEHYFIDDQKADRILNSEIVPAKSQIGEHRYFVTKDELEDKSKNLYIIDPKGIAYLLENFADIRNFVILYIDADDYTRYERAKNRPGFDEEIYKQRVENESAQFKAFEAYIQDEFEDRYGIKTYRIFNSYWTNGEYSKYMFVHRAKQIILDTYKNSNTMYLVVGKSCSGKDTLCNLLVKDGI